jgi:glycosyltransferase involved in cell wall biosynthesis
MNEHQSQRRVRVLMLLENSSYPADPRVRCEAESLASAGYSVTVIAPRSEGEPVHEVLQGVRVKRYRVPRSSGDVRGFMVEYAVSHALLAAATIRELARGMDVLHLHNPPDTLFPIGALARTLHRRVVFDHHDLFPELYEVKFGGGGVGMRAARLAQRLSFGVAHHVLVTNESQRQIAIDRGSVDIDKVTVVRNGPRRAVLARAEPSRRGQLADPELIFVGMLEPQDGVLDLPALLRAVRSDPRTPEARLKIVGDGTCLAQLRADVISSGLSGSVTFTGRVPHSRIPELLARSDICIDPAPCNVLNQRSTMVKIAEYIAAARPVVAYELTETRRTAGEAAVYAPCGDAARFAALVVDLAQGPEIRARLAARGQQRAHALVWERSEEALLRAYRALNVMRDRA